MRRPREKYKSCHVAVNVLISYLIKIKLLADQKVYSVRTVLNRVDTLRSRSRCVFFFIQDGGRLIRDANDGPPGVDKLRNKNTKVIH
jgi:hypothetical protein